MYYLKSQYQINPLHRGMIESFAKTNGTWTAQDREAIKSLIDIYQVTWWMSFDDRNDNTEAMLEALKKMLGLPTSMTDHVAAQVFRTAMRQRGGIQNMLAAVYEEVAPGTEEKYGHSPAPIDWAKEVAHMDEIRDKAIAYLTEAMTEVKLMPLPIETGCTQVACFNGRLEFSQKPPRELYRTVTSADLTLGQLIEVAAYVQKAIAGGNNA